MSMRLIRSAIRLPLSSTESHFLQTVRLCLQSGLGGGIGEDNSMLLQVFLYLWITKDRVGKSVRFYCLRLKRSEDFGNLNPGIPVDRPLTPKSTYLKSWLSWFLFLRCHLLAGFSLSSRFG